MIRNSMIGQCFERVLPLMAVFAITGCGAGSVADEPETTRAPNSKISSSVSTASTSASEKTEIFFPRQRGNGGAPDALGGGKLVLDDEGCIRMKFTPNDTPGIVPVWRREFDLDVQGEEVRILNGKGRIVAKIGEEVRMGGGELPGVKGVLAVDRKTARELQERCPGGGYWLVGEGVEITGLE